MFHPGFGIQELLGILLVRPARIALPSGGGRVSGFGVSLEVPKPRALNPKRLGFGALALLRCLGESQVAMYGHDELWCEWVGTRLRVQGMEGLGVEVWVVLEMRVPFIFLVIRVPYEFCSCCPGHQDPRRQRKCTSRETRPTPLEADPRDNPKH